MDHLIVEQHAGWVALTLNRPAVKNALNTALLGDVAAALAACDADPACRTVLISGAGGHFAAGADIAEMATKTAADSAGDPRKAHWAAIRAFGKPLIAAVDGYALGGGFELALKADLIVLGATARVGLPETSLGVIPGAGGTQHLLALIGRARASRMILTGEVIDAATAYDWGIAGWLAAGSALPDATALAIRVATRAPLALRAAKSVLVAGDEANRAFVAERAAFEALHDTGDKAEGIAAFLAKRPPSFTGT